MQQSGGVPVRAFPAFRAGLRAAAAIAIAAAVFSFSVPVVPSIAVRESRTGRLVASLPGRKGGSFALAYIHSANKGAVLDEFRVAADGGLVMERSVFQSFGAGMSDGLDEGVSMRMTEEGVELSGLARRIGELGMAVGTVAGHRLIAGGAEIALAERIAAGSFVTIAYKRIPLAAAIRERIRNGREKRR